MADPGNPKKKPTGNYEVGFAKTPKHSQFKPGQSGNPKGGKKVARTIDQLVDDELSRLTAVKLGGEIVKITKREALAKRLVSDAIGGKHHALRLVLNLPSQLSETDGTEPDGPLSEDEVQQMLMLMRLPEEQIDE